MQNRTGYIRERVRKLLKDTGQTSAPIDLEKICAQLGFKFLEAENFNDNISALCVKMGNQKIAAVNKKHTVVRKRFSLAHEIGHWLLGHLTDDLLPIVTMDAPPDPSSFRRFAEGKEHEANAFAAELLVPTHFFKDVLKRTDKLEELCSIFLVSKQTMSIKMLSIK